MLSARPFYDLARATFKRADHGLFGGKHIQFGNNNPFSKKKTRRTWLPNVQHKKLYSETFGHFFDLRVTTSVLRTIDKKGGLDRYLLETSEKNLFGKLALQMRRNLEAKLQDRDDLGLPGVEMDVEEEMATKDEKEAKGLVVINPIESKELALRNEEEGGKSKEMVVRNMKEAKGLVMKNENQGKKSRNRVNKKGAK